MQVFNHGPPLPVTLSNTHSSLFLSLSGIHFVHIKLPLCSCNLVDTSSGNFNSLLLPSASPSVFLLVSAPFLFVAFFAFFATLKAFDTVTDLYFGVCIASYGLNNFILTVWNW